MSMLDHCILYGHERQHFLHSSFKKLCFYMIFFFSHHYVLQSEYLSGFWITLERRFDSDCDAVFRLDSERIQEHQLDIYI